MQMVSWFLAFRKKGGAIGEMPSLNTHDVTVMRHKHISQSTAILIHLIISQQIRVIYTHVSFSVTSCGPFY